jgi:hypothetical protein
LAKEYTSNEITKIALMLLQAKGFDVWRQNQVKVPGRAFVGKKGLSDIIGFDPSGKFVLCEVKKKGDKMRQEQIELLTKANKAGCLCYMAVQVDDRIELQQYQVQENNTHTMISEATIWD